MKKNPVPVIALLIVAIFFVIALSVSMKKMDNLYGDNGSVYQMDMDGTIKLVGFQPPVIDNVDDAKAFIKEFLNSGDTPEIYYKRTDGTVIKIFKFDKSALFFKFDGDYHNKFQILEYIGTYDVSDL